MRTKYLCNGKHVSETSHGPAHKQGTDVRQNDIEESPSCRKPLGELQLHLQI